jgi:hypothetical protein
MSLIGHSSIAALLALAVLATPAFSQVLFHGSVRLTFPERNYTPDPTLATLTWSRPECASNHLIPYIQASSVLTVNATALVPLGGGVRFALTPTTGPSRVEYGMVPPYTATFHGLSKGTYTLDAVVVDAARVAQLGSDRITGISVGDIYVLIGDSTTVGQAGIAYKGAPYPNWTVAPNRSADDREYAHCGLTMTNGRTVTNWVQYQGMDLEMGDLLTAMQGSPVFVWNAAVGSSSTSTWLGRLGTIGFAQPMAQIRPNKAFIDLGINDGGGSSLWQARITAMADGLHQTYGISYGDIMLAIPGALTRGNWHPYWEQAVASRGLARGPDFLSWFSTHVSQLLPDWVHPTATGYTSKASLTVNAIAAAEPPPISEPPTRPEQVVATATSASSIALTWGPSFDVVSVASYQVDRCRGDGCGDFAMVGTTVELAYADDGLTQETSYSYRVRALDTAGTLSANSDVATAVTPAVLGGGSDITIPCIYSGTASPACSIVIPPYECRRQTGGSSWVVILRGATTIGAQSIPNPTRGVEYQMRCEVGSRVELSINGVLWTHAPR